MSQKEYLILIEFINLNYTPKNNNELETEERLKKIIKL